MQIESKRLCPLFLLILLQSFVLLSCSKKQIEGVVQDPFGKAIEGVSVKIEKSAFTATTNALGEYKIDYVPGTILLNFSKTGYSSDSLELTIQQKSKYPAQTTILYPLPDQPSIFWLSDAKMVELTTAKISKRKYSTSWMDPNHYKYHALPMTQLVVKPGVLEFLDAAPEKHLLVRLGPGGLIQEFSSVFGVIKYNYYTPMNDEVRILTHGVSLRQAELPEGDYAWVRMVRTLDDRVIPKDNGICYPFRVHSEGTGEVVEMH